MSHQCKALVVSCMDYRLQTTLHSFLIRKGLNDKYDHFSVAGAQKAFLDGHVAMNHVSLSKELHGITEVYLIAHQDCGAYGGSEAFEDESAEMTVYQDDLESAKNMILEAHPELTVHTFIAELRHGHFYILG